jgi:hypothetical protein
MTVRARILGVEVERTMREGRGGEERIVAGVDAAAPMMLEDLAFAEFLERIPFVDELELTEKSEIGICHKPSS